MNRYAFAVSATMTLSILAVAQHLSAPASDKVNPRTAQTRLELGHSRFVSGKPQHPNATNARVIETSGGQKPYATVLSCSDSRVPPEVIFDQGLGDIFVVRVAGNVCGPSEMATVEYGVGHLETPMLIVLGHSKCGAVTASATDAKVHGSIPGLLARIKPAVIRAKKICGEDKEEIVPTAIRENVWLTIETMLKQSDEVRARVTSGKLRIVGALYNLSSGTVDWLGEHPGQSTILRQSSATESVRAKPSAAAPAKADEGHKAKTGH